MPPSRNAGRPILFHLHHARQRASDGQVLMDGGDKIDQLQADYSARSRDAHRRHSLAFIASVAAHAIILVALVFLLPEIARPHHDWVLAYLVEFDQPGTAGRGAGTGDSRASA